MYNMATESPLRMSPHKDTTTFAPSTPSMAVEDIAFLRKGQRFRANGGDVVPNRSGSAPPSMEGSFLAINNLVFQQNADFENLSGAVQNFESERLSYMDYKDSKVNPSPMFLTPPIWRDYQNQGSHIGRFRSKTGLTSLDDGGNSSRNLSQVTLSTHKEESEDDRSPHQPSDDLVDRTSGFWSGSMLAGQSSSSVNLIQEDYPRTPSPVHGQSHSLSSATTDEAVDHDADSSSLHNPHVSTSNAFVSSFLPLKFLGNTQTMQPPFKGNLNSFDFNVIESEMKDLSISSLPISKEKKYQQQRPHSFQGNSVHVQNAKPHLGYRGETSTFISPDQFLYSPSKFSTEVQPVLQLSGFTPHYASAEPYMASPNPFYANLQPPGLYSPQYSMGGYALNSAVVPPFMAGYPPPHGTIPVVFDGARVPGASVGGNIPHGTDMQHVNKFYGQLGCPMQPQFTNPSYVQYYQPPYGQAYNISGPFDPLAHGGGIIGNQIGSPDSKKAPEVAEQKLHHQISGMSILYEGRGVISPHYYASSSNTGMLMQYPSSSQGSLVLPGGTGNSGGRNVMNFPTGADRYASVYSGWQGPRGSESFNDRKIYNFLEELKSGKGHRFELSDIAGSIVEFSADQHGSRFIQQKLETCNAEEKSSVFKEVLPFASKLMTDVFGNYVIQKFFEHGTPEQRKELANQLTGQILPLSLQMYGCRVIQKALEVIELDQKAQLVHELDGHVMWCIRDQNGNHVIQKSIETIPMERIGFIISAFRGNVAALSMHPYGCRVIQRVLEHCTDELQCQFIVDEILESACVLAQDQYGNYVTQHVLERGKSQERNQIVNKLLGHIVQLSQHKFASNVVEKCLDYGGPPERELIVEEVLSLNEENDNLLVMIKDQFANYVVQKILDLSTDTQRTMLLNRIKTHAHALQKYTYGKHIAVRFEQQFEEHNQTS